MITKKSWMDFLNSGLLMLINQLLHAFGWAICIEINDAGEVTDAYPALVKFRGFSEETVDEGYKRISNYLNSNSEEVKYPHPYRSCEERPLEPGIAWVIKVMNLNMFRGLTDANSNAGTWRDQNAAWYSTKAAAIKAILSDKGHISEDGTNEFAVILPIREGTPMPLVDDFNLETWFIFNRDLNKYVETPTPIIKRQILLNF